MEFSATEIIDRIKSLSTTKDLSSLGYTPQIFNNWKTRNSIPRSDDLYKIAQYLNVSMEWLLTGKDLDLDSVYKSKYEALVKAIQNLPIN